MKKTEITIAICVRNPSQAIFKSCLDKLEVALKRSQTTTYELLVVDQSVKTGIERVIDRHAIAHLRSVSWRYIRSSQKGVVFSRNLALREGKCSYLLFLDADVLVSPNLIDSVLRTLRAYPMALGVGGKILPSKKIDGNPLIGSIQEPQGIWSLALTDMGDAVVTFPSKNYPHFFCTAFLVLNLQHIRSSGLMFDERFGNGQRTPNLFGGEDLDFVARALKAKAIFVYDPNIVVHHHISKRKLTRTYFWWRYFEHGKEVAGFDRKNRGVEENMHQIKLLLKEGLFNLRRSFAYLFFGRRKNFWNVLRLAYTAGYVFYCLAMISSDEHY